MPELIAAAARNTAIFCDRLCRAHGVGSRFRPGLWRRASSAPPLIPDAITLPGRPGPPPLVELRALLDAHPAPLLVSDSAAALDLAREGLVPGAESSWIARHDAPAAPAPLPLTRITHATDLGHWERFWRREQNLPAPHVQFPPELIARRDLAVLAHLGRDARPGGGGILFRACGLVTVSNLFSLGPPLETLFAALAAEAARLWPGLPLVGCESGARLDAARTAGFTPVGQIRLWHHPGQTS